MATFLLIIIYITYVGLGIPDSLLGAAWPAIYKEFSLPVSYASLITILISCGTVVSSFFSARIINRFGTANVTALSTMLTAAAILGFSFSQNMLCLCLCAVPLGLGAGAIDTALNNYVALHYKANHMNFLHCFYGVGVSLSPYLMSVALSDDNAWRNGYQTMFYFQLAIAVLAILSLPLWKKVNQKHVQQEESPRTLNTIQIFKTKGAKPLFGVLFFSCAIESVCLVWGSTFLVGSKGLTADKAAEIITLYFVGLAIGRFVSGLLANKLSGVKIIIIGQTITLAAIILIALPSSFTAAAIGLFLIGFGNGPVYPNITHLTPIAFGRNISQSMIGMQMALAYIGIMLSPFIFGLLAQYCGVFLMPYYLLLMFMIMIISTFILLPMLKSKGIK